jgi:CRP-like cAMP-binding protein
MPVAFRKNEIIHHAHSPAKAIYFIESGLVSRTVRTRSDAPLEIAMEGSSGVVGQCLLLGQATALNQTVAIVPASGLKITSDLLRGLFGEHPSLRDVLLRQTHSLAVQMASISLCNTKHLIDGRVPRWLVMASECLGSDMIPVTHDLIATSLGVRRPGVSEVLQTLELDGIIEKARGAIKIKDASRLLQQSCGCHRSVGERNFGPRGPIHAHLLP